MIRSLLAALSLLPAALLAQTQTVLLPAIADATLYQDTAGGVANGSGQYLFVGMAGGLNARRAVLKFDIVAAIPQKSRIVDVELRLMVSRSTATTNTPATLHRVLAAWNEGPTVAPGGEGAGGPSLAGDTTWLHTAYPSALWAQPGGDYDAQPSAQATMPPLGAFQFTKNEDLIADIQHWLNGSRPNHGWLVRSPESANDLARRIDSRNNTAVAGVQPQLLITYLPPGNIEAFGAGCVTSGGVPITQTITGPAVQGGQITLQLSSGVARALYVTMLSYDVTPQPIASADCFVWLRPIDYPILTLRQQDLLGNSTDVFPLPFEPVLFGTPFAVQSGIVDFAHPRQYALSNGHLICVR